MVCEVVSDHAVVFYSGASGLAEISAAGVTKAAALEVWCSTKGIDSAEVSRSVTGQTTCRCLGGPAGLLVSNADPDVLDVVDEACPSKEQDEVAQVL